MRALAGAAAAIIALMAAGAEAADMAGVPRFKRIIVVVFENKDYDDLIGKPKVAPTFNLMARRYGLLERYYAVERPSLPNYLALVSGSTQGVTETCTECIFDARNLADTIEASGRTWKTYAEGLPKPGFTGAEAGSYVKRHNPFPYFESVVSKPARLRRIVGYGEFARDLQKRRLPDFSLVVPDLCNSMHDCPISTGDAWLKRFLGPLLASRQLDRSVVFVTFDEGADSRLGGGGHILTLALGPMVRTGADTAKGLNHYGLLRTIEEAWGLPLLGKSARANSITGIWR